MDRSDVLGTTKPLSGKAIRLTQRQWYHITEAHDYMAGNIDRVMETVNSPDCLVEGLRGELIALKHYVEAVR